MRFRASVWVRALDLQILAVSTVEDARAILRRWPHDARADQFVEVRNVLEKAAAGGVAPEDARRSFVSLLEQANMLAESTPA